MRNRVRCALVEKLRDVLGLDVGKLCLHVVGDERRRLERVRDVVDCDDAADPQVLRTDRGGRSRVAHIWSVACELRLRGARAASRRSAITASLKGVGVDRVVPVAEEQEALDDLIRVPFVFADKEMCCRQSTPRPPPAARRAAGEAGSALVVGAPFGGGGLERRRAEEPVLFLDCGEAGGERGRRTCVSAGPSSESRARSVRRRVQEKLEE